MILVLLFLLVTHWVADFIVQTDWQAQNKSKSNQALLHHVASYSACLLMASLLVFTPLTALLFTLVNGALHFGTDWATSRWSSEMWRKGDRHNFFVVVGLDQLIHQLTLAFTLIAFAGRV